MRARSWIWWLVDALDDDRHHQAVVGRLKYMINRTQILLVT